MQKYMLLELDDTEDTVRGDRPNWYLCHLVAGLSCGASESEMVKRLRNDLHVRVQTTQLRVREKQNL